MIIRKATESNASEISNLVLSSALACRDEDFDNTGWDFFVRLNSIRETLNRITDSDNIFLCCIDRDKIAGIIVIKGFEKIDQLFVLKEYRRSGVARQLWTCAKNLCKEMNPRSEYWVRSSTHAVPVYKRFGFVQQGEPQIKNGIRFTLLSSNSTI